MSQLLELLAHDGRKRKIERTFSINCLVCRATVSLPLGADPWFWFKTEEVRRFVDTHRDHGNERTIGAEVVFLEKE